MFWSDLVDLLRALIFGVAHVCNGSVGVAVILVSFTIRLALLPLTLRLARRAREHQRRLKELQPELERLQRRYAKDPATLWRETLRLYRRRGVKHVDSAGLLGGLAQASSLRGALLNAAPRTGIGNPLLLDRRHVAAKPAPHRRGRGSHRGSRHGVPATRDQSRRAAGVRCAHRRHDRLVPQLNVRTVRAVDWRGVVGWPGPGRPIETRPAP